MKLPKQFHHATQGHIVKEAGGTWLTVKQELPEGAYEKHLLNGRKFGIPFVRPVENTAMAGLFDLDDHSGEVGWQKVKLVADNLMNRASEYGIILHPFISTGGKGIHLWALWDEPQPAGAIKWILETIATDVGYTVGAKGVISNQVEVFPKQGQVNDGDVGNCAALPSIPLDGWTFEQVDTVRWSLSDPIQGWVDDAKLPMAEVREVSNEQLKEIIDAVPNDDLDYDTWWNVIMAIHHAGGTLEQAEAWSAKSSKYQQGYLARKWESIRRHDGNVVTVRTLMKMATDAGWGGFTADVGMFPDGLSGEIVEEYDRVTVKGRYFGYKVSNITQLTRVMSSDPQFPWIITYDNFTQDRVLQDKRTGSLSVLGDEHYVYIQAWFDENRFEPVPYSTVRTLCHAVAMRNQTDMALNWANSLQWDGVDRYEEMLLQMGVEPTEYYMSVVRYQWTSHAARIIHAGYQADAIIIYISEEQGLGKTQLIKSFAPNIHGIDTYQDVHIDMLLSEDKAARAMKGSLVVNLDEMRHFTKREAAEVKSALSRTKESYIPKYLEKKCVFGRRGVLYATNNETEFLDDHTGNRRYHTIIVGKVNLKWFKENCNQLWAQGIHDFKTNGQAWQKALELAPEHIAQHDITDEWTDVIGHYLSNLMTDETTISDVCRIALGIPIAQVDRRVQMRVGKSLRKLGWDKLQVRRGDKIVKVFTRKGK